MAVREVLEPVLSWMGEGKRVAVATVVEVIQKAPRDPGSAMAVCEDGRVAGSVSGGCVEPAVIEVALEVLEQGAPRLITFGISDEQAFEVGLSCGGTIHVWVELLQDREAVALLQQAVREGRAFRPAPGCWCRRIPPSRCGAPPATLAWTPAWRWKPAACWPRTLRPGARWTAWTCSSSPSLPRPGSS